MIGRQIFVDMDGVLADFDRHHETVFGVRSSKEADNVDWEAVRSIKGFYASIPPMADAYELWKAVLPYRPTVLTGVPYSVAEAPANKRDWVARHLGPDVPVICCRSSEKCRYAKAGDILIDDWAKYRHLWEGVGGVFILHTSAAESIARLEELSGIEVREIPHPHIERR